MCVCELSKTMQQKNVRFSDCGKFLFWKNLQLLEDCKKTHPKFHEVLAVILKGVIEGLRTGLATCRFLYIGSIGSAPSISLYDGNKCRICLSTLSKLTTGNAFRLQWYQNHSNFHCYQQIQSLLITLYFKLRRI
jgi:hypothetical protein